MTRFNVSSHIEIHYASSNGAIVRSFAETAYLSGYVLGIGLSNVRTHSKIARDKQSVRVTANASVDSYILINGLIKVFSEPISHTITYRL